MSDDRSKQPAEGHDPADQGGSYTARPSQEEPEDGTTRDEDQEKVERTGSGPDAGSPARTG